MRMKDAVVERFRELCLERGIKFNELATSSGVTPSTVYSMMDNRRKDVSVVTFRKTHQNRWTRCGATALPVAIVEFTTNLLLLEKSAPNTSKRPVRGQRTGLLLYGLKGNRSAGYRN